MGIKLNKNDVNYLTNKLQTDNLIENAAEIGLGNLIAQGATDDQIARVTTTGNVLNYLSGQLVATGNIAADQIIGILPATRKAKAKNYHVVPINDGTGTIVVSIEDQNIVNVDVGLTASDQIHLDGIMYEGVNE